MRDEPDSDDFSDVEGINVYEDTNAFYKQIGWRRTPTINSREINGQVRQTSEQRNHFELIGEGEGLKTETFLTQERFLVSVVQQEPGEIASDRWTAAQIRQFQTLTHPEQLGRRFINRADPKRHRAGQSRDPAPRGTPRSERAQR